MKNILNVQIWGQCGNKVVLEQFAKKNEDEIMSNLLVQNTQKYFESYVTIK